MSETPKFKDYKEEQKYFKALTRRGRIIYDPCKIYNKNGKLIRKGTPYKKPKPKQKVGL